MPVTKPDHRFILFLVSFAAATGLVSAPGLGQFLPPGWLNPAAPFDNVADHFASQLYSPNGDLHVVWATQGNYSGSSGTDPDLYYARFRDSAWSAPVLVNDFGDSDGVIDDRPRIAIGPDGTLHCVWQSELDTTGESDGDFDIFYSQNSGQGWSPAEKIGPDRSDHTGVDPNLAVAGNGEVVVLWRTPTDLQWIRRLKEQTWGTALVNDEASGPAAMTTSEDGLVLAIWPYRQRTNGKRTFKTARLAGDFTLPGQYWPTFSDSDTDSFDPALITIGSGSRREVHVAWATNEDRDGIGTDIDLLYGIGLAAYPYRYGPWPLNVSAGIDSGADVAPSLCAEPGGVLHAVWQSDSDLFTGTDRDVYHAVNAGLGGDWSLPALLGWNGLSDAANEHDERPTIACHPDHFLSGLWDSNDDLGGSIGSDWDVLHALGLGRLFHRPFPVAPWTTLDNEKDTSPAIVADGDTLHVVWASDHTGWGLSTGFDYDIYHVSIGPEGRSAHRLASTWENGVDGNDSAPSLAIDPTGTLHLLWTGVRGVDDGDLDVFHSEYDGSSWSPPTPLEPDDSTGDGDDQFARLVADDIGRLHAVWYQMDGNGVPRAAYSRRTGTQWSTPTDPFAALTGWMVMPALDLAVDPSGTPHVAAALASNTLGETDVFYTRKGTSGWTAPEAVDGTPNGDGALDYIPALALTPGGEPIVVWPSYRPDQAAGLDADLWIVRREQSGWSAPVLLHQHFQSDVGLDIDPDLVVDGDHLNVVWSSDDPLGGANLGADRDLFHLRLPLSQIAPAALPSSLPIGVPNPQAPEDQGDDIEPQIASANGVLHFVWGSDDTLGLEPATGDADVLHGQLSLFAALFRDGFESGGLDSWSSQTP